ncbi:MAG TPA: MFS transporter [Candidatus Pullilachnospira intestinigallinarum]|nr:MFS transporter [Candidatus Pullilachnospira intestinigallinarum]
MVKFKKISDEKMAFLLFALCWAAYFTSYIGRLNYSSAMTAMIGEQVLSKTEAGFISMVYFFAYGIGQLTNGIMGDRFHPGKMIFTGLAVAAGANFLMGLATSFLLMTVIWGVNGYAQAMIWPPIIRIFAEMLEEKQKLKYCINIVSSQVVGTLAAYLLAAAVMWMADWRSVFGAAALCLAVMALVWLRGFHKVERFSMEHGREGQEAGRRMSAGRQESFSRVLTVSGLALVIFPVVIHGMLKDGVTSWVPTYISETFLTSPSLSILVTTVLPVINLTGAYAAQLIYPRCRRREVETAAVFFAAATAALAGLRLAGSVSMILTAVLFAVITASMMAVNTVFVNLLPLRFEKTGRVSTVSGFLNAMAYLGTAVSTFTIGVMVEKFGWDVTIDTWVALTAAALVLCVIKRKKVFRIPE